MDHQTLIFDVSSDEEFGLDNSSSADNFDWISKFLVDDDDIGFPPVVNNGRNPACDATYHNYDGSKIDNDSSNTIGDDDDVVVVGEVIAKPKRAKRSFHNTAGGGGDDDYDCMVLEFDPDKPPKKVAVTAANDEEVKDRGGDDDDDDLVVVGEKGQVACRDFPHSRHLCANLPFSSTPHESCCAQCHCYVCDSVAPCVLWGSGASSTDHCNATDKVEYWQLERKRFRQTKNPSPVTAKLVASLPQLPRSPHLSARPILLPRLAASCGVSPLGAPNIISQCRNQRATVAVARNGFQPRLVARQLSRALNGNTPSTRVVHPASTIAPSRALLKRPGVANRSAYNAPNNVSVAHLRPQSQQLAGKPFGNSSANPRHCPPRLVTSPSSCHSNTSCISPRTFPSPLQGCGLPSPQTPTSRFQGCVQSPAAINFQPHMYSSVYPTQSISSPIIPHTASSALNILSQNRQQISSVTQNFSSSDNSCSRSDMLTGVSQNSNPSSAITQTYFSPSELCSSVFAQSNVAQSSCQQHSAEKSSADRTLPMHEGPPSVEQDSQPSQVYGFEEWLEGLEPVSPSLDTNQPSASASMDPGMLYFDFETSWKGLAHT